MSSRFGLVAVVSGAHHRFLLCRGCFMKLIYPHLFFVIIFNHFNILKLILWETYHVIRTPREASCNNETAREKLKSSLRINVTN